MLVDLKHDGLQHERGGRNHVQSLLGLSQPVDEVLERVVEIRGQHERLLQLHLQTKHVISILCSLMETENYLYRHHT